MIPAWRRWLLAARPATLTAAVAPVLVGGGVAVHQARLRPFVWIATLLTAVLLQVGANLVNDAADFERGADAEGRLGPRRATQSGLLTVGQVRRAALAVFATALLLGVFLAVVGGWPIVAVGAVSIAAACLYTAGPWPYGYHGLGDLFVFVFFGVVAVVGTAYLQTGRVTPPALAASLPIACTVTAILVVNNLRDAASDARAGKRTLAVLLGPRRTRLQYALLMLAPFALVGGFALAGVLPGGAWLPWLLVVPAGVLVTEVVRGAQGERLNTVLKRTALLHLGWGVLLAGGLGW